MRHLAEYAGARVTRAGDAPVRLPGTVRGATPPAEEAGAAPPCPAPGTLWVHAGGDLYRVVGPAMCEMAGGCWQDAVAYVAHGGGGGTVFTRPLNRFHARFKEVLP